MSSNLPVSQLNEFLEHLFATGEARLAEPVELGDRSEVESVLDRAFRRYRLDIAGPRIEFDRSAGVAAAMFLANACWFTVSRDDPPEVVTKRLKPLDPPSTASAYLSIDLTLRYATTVHRRVLAQSRDDVLGNLLTDMLRRCPLTGVLSDVDQDPIGDLSFAGDSGLQLLFAERLAEHFRPNWLPAEGRTREAIELVFQQKGRAWPP